MPEDNDPAIDLRGVDFGTDDVLVGGRVDLNPAGAALLVQALPPVGRVRGSGATATNLRGTIHRLFDEVSTRRAGAEFAIRQHSAAPGAGDGALPTWTRPTCPRAGCGC